MCHACKHPKSKRRHTCDVGPLLACGPYDRIKRGPDGRLWKIRAQPDADGVTRCKYREVVVC